MGSMVFNQLLIEFSPLKRKLKSDTFIVPWGNAEQFLSVLAS